VGHVRIIVELAGVNRARAQDVIARTTKLVYTTCVPDPKAPAGRETVAGFRPQISSLTGDMISNANASLDANGVNWVVNVTFNSQGSDLFAKMTEDAVAACPDSSSNPQCPQRYLGIWLGLNQEDVDQWDDQDFVTKVTADPGNGGKLLTNPYPIQPITVGQA